MSRWAEQDARRVANRVRRLQRAGEIPTAEQVSYLRAAVMNLLLGPFADDLPVEWLDDLRKLLGILEVTAAYLDGEAPAP